MNDDYSGHRVINKTIRTACIPASYPSSPQKPIMDWDWRFGLKDLACGSELSFARPSAATAVFPGANVKTVASNVPRFESNGIPLEGSATNKVTCAKSNPQDLTNTRRSGEASAVISIVNDAAELAQMGFSIFGPNVYKIDNSAGSTSVWLWFDGQVGNTNQHSRSLILRVAAGTARMAWSNDSGNGSPLTNSSYARITDTLTPSATTHSLTIKVFPNSVAYCVMPQLEEGPVCTSPIPGGTGAITRASEGSDTSNNGLTMPLTQAMINSLSSGGSGTIIQTVYLPWDSSLVSNDTDIVLWTVFNSTTGSRFAIRRYSSGSFYPVYLSDGVTGSNFPTTEIAAGRYALIAQWSAITSQMRAGLYNPATGILTWGNYATYRGFFPIYGTGDQQRLRFFYGGGSFNINLISTQWFNCVLTDDDMLFYIKKFGCARYE